MTARRTGRKVRCWGIQLAEVDRVLSDHGTIEVNGVWYYTYDFGGFVVGSRTATSTDHGGNDVGRGVRTAPESLAGMAAPLRRGSYTTRIKFGPPEIVGAGHCE